MVVVVGLFHIYALAESWAEDKKQTLQEMQQRLNQEVISQPFSVADEAKVKSYIEDATRRGLVPSAQPGPHWRPGYTCQDLTPYSWQEYRDCRYYHWYYGYYYR
jgi:hypothetical protein